MNSPFKLFDFNCCSETDKNKETQYIQEEVNYNLLDDNGNAISYNQLPIEFYNNEAEFNLIRLGERSKKDTLILKYEVNIGDRISIQNVQPLLIEDNLLYLIISEINQEVYEDGFLFYSENQSIYIKLQINVTENIQFQELNKVIQEHQMKKIDKMVKYVQKFKKIIRREEILEKQKEKSLFQNQYNATLNILLTQDYEEKQQSDSKHIFLQKIDIVGRDSEKIYFQYQGDNNLCQGPSKSWDLQDNFEQVFDKKYYSLSQSEFESEGKCKQNPKLFACYGIHLDENKAYQFTHLSEDIESQMRKGKKFSLYDSIKILISVTKALQLLHQQNLSHGKLCLREIFLDLNNDESAILDILHNYFYQREIRQITDHLATQQQDIFDLGRVIDELILKNVILNQSLGNIF